MKKTHTHHIIPKHMGGTDDPSNLVELTVRQHALAHKKLYKEHGKWEDKIAYEMLSGQINKYEAQQQVRRLANLGNKNAQGMTHTKEYKKRLSLMMEERRKKYIMGNLKPHKQTTKEKISESLKGNTNKKGKTGYTLSEETRKKMSKAKSGKNNPATRPEVREKLRQAALRRYK